MRYLITGGAGFIGSNVARRLVREGNYVHVLDNLFRGSLMNISDLLESELFSFHKIDLEFEESISQVSKIISTSNIDVVLHYAAINGTQYFYDIPERVAVVNSVVTYNLMRAIESSNKKLEIVFASTSENYGDPDIIPTPENGKTYFRIDQDRDSYSVAKMMSEFYVKLYSKKLGIKYLILRIFNVYGKGMIGSKYGQVIPEFIKRLQEGEYPLKIYGKGNHTRSFCHIDDHIELTIRLINSDFRNGVVNLGNDNEISILDLAHLTMKAMGLDPKIEFGKEREGDHLRRCPDISLLFSITGDYDFISLEEGILKSI